MPIQEVAFVDQSVCDRSPGCPASYYCPSASVDVKKGKAKGGLFKMFTIVEAIQVNTEKCTGYGTCVQMCPHKAIALREIVGSSDR